MPHPAVLCRHSKVYPRRRRSWATTLLVALSCTLSSLATTDPVQRFLTNDDKQIWGVLLRQDSKSFTLAMPNEVLVLPKNTIKFAGTWTKETKAVNEILVTAESLLNQKNVERAQKYLAPLAAAVDEFDRVSQPFLTSNLATPHQRQQCIRTAQGYYRQRLREIPDTIKLIAMIDRLVATEKEIESKARRYSSILLTELLEFDAVLLDKAVAPKALRRAREQAQQILATQIKKSMAELHSSAIGELRKSVRSQPALAYLAVLKKSEQSTSAKLLPEAMDKFLRACEAVAAGYRRELPPRVEALFALDGLEAKQRAYNTAIGRLRDLTTFFEACRPFALNASKANNLAFIAKQIDQNKQLVERSTARRNTIKNIRAELRKAELMLEREEVKSALKQYDSLSALIKREGFPESEIQQKIRDGVFQARAIVRLQTLKSPFSLNKEQLDELLEGTRKFLTDDKERLVAAGFRPALYDAELSKLGLYRTFRINYDSLKNTLAGDPVKSWHRITILADWVKQKETEMYEAAVSDWNTFVSQTEGPLYKRAKAVFLKNEQFMDAKRLQILIGFIEYCLRNNASAEALELVEVGLKLLPHPPNRDAQTAVLDKKVLVGAQMAERGDYVNSSKVFQDISEQFPDFAELRELDGKIARTMHRRAEELEKAGDSAAAVKLYNQVLTTNPKYATAQGLFDRLVRLRVSMLPPAPKPPPPPPEKSPTEQPETEEKPQPEDGAPEPDEPDEAGEPEDSDGPAEADEAEDKLEAAEADPESEASPEEADSEQTSETVRTADPLLKLLDEIAGQYPEMVKDTTDFRKAAEDFATEFSGNWESTRYLPALKELEYYQTTYPNLAKENQVLLKSAEMVNRHVQEYLQVAEDSGKPIPKSLTTAVKTLLTTHSKVSRDNNLDKLYLQMQMNRADGFIQTSQIIKAFDIYRELETDYPEFATEQDLQGIMDRLRWRHQRERIAVPLGLQKQIDWILFILALVLWPYFLYRSLYLGKRRGHLKYRMIHLSTLFTVFCVLLVAFLYGKFAFSKAFLYSFVMPELFFQILGFATYRCFPLIYCERLLALERSVVGVFESRALAKTKFLTSNALFSMLKNDINRRENDLPLLHDRTLFAIHHAVRTAEAKPEKGFEMLKKELNRLDHELLQNEAWKRNYQTCLFEMGNVAQRCGKVDEAIGYYERDLEMDGKNPNNFEERKVLAELLFDKNEFHRAMPHIKVCLAAIGGTDRLWYRLGRCFFETGNNLAAYKCFDSVSKKDRDTLFYGARAFARANERKKSIEWYQNVLKNHPQDSEAMYYLASSFAQHAENEKAVKLVGLLKEGQPFFAAGQALIGNLFYRAGKLDHARAAFEKANQLDPATPQALIGLGQLAAEAGNEDEAIAYFKRVLETEENHGTANYLLGTFLEKADPTTAIDHFTRAAQSGEYRRAAENRLGRLFFFQKDYQQAEAHFAIAEEEGEQSPWFLYFYTCALTESGKHEHCEKVLFKLLGRNFPDESWQQRQVHAMYSMANRFFEKRAFNLALQCHEYVRERLSDATALAKLDEFIEETRFRLVISLLGNGEYIAAQNTVAELQIETQDKARSSICQYYLALSQLYLGDFTSANAVLSALLQQDAQNARFLYHRIVAELGLNNIVEASELLKKLRDFPNIPPHLAVGIHTIRSFLTAQQQNLRDAELGLAVIPELNSEFPGHVYVKQKVLLTRVLYLCHLRDSKRLNELTSAVAEDQREQVVYLHAVAAVASEQPEVAMELLKPHAANHPPSRRLFQSLCAEIAKQAVARRNYEKARMVLEQVEAPPPQLNKCLIGARMSELISNTADRAAVVEAIGSCQEELQQTNDPELTHSLTHNLAILRIRQAIMAEEDSQRDSLLDVWESCLEFLYQNVLKSPDFWNRELARIHGGTFAASEIETLNRNYVAKNFIDLFVAYIIIYLDIASEDDIDRHMTLLVAVGEENGQLKTYLGALSKRLNQYFATVKDDSEKQQTWDFQICKLSLQCRVNELLEVEDYQALQEELATCRQCQAQYDTPKDHRAAKSKFSFDMLDALQTGAMGKFQDAGNKLELLLQDIPPGQNLGELEETLRTLRGYCVRPAECANRGIDLNAEFDKTYSQVKTN